MDKKSQIETKAFLRLWKENGNVSFTLVNGQVLNQCEALDEFLLDFLQTYDANKKNPVNYIKGCDKADGFSISLPSKCSEKYIKYICKDIWDNPTQYWEHDYECDEDHYYNFLKFIWVTWNGKEYRLGDLALDKVI